MSENKLEDQLIGKPRIAKLLGVSHPTASMYMARGFFPSTEVDGRAYARVGDVIRYREERQRAARRQESA